MARTEAVVEEAVAVVEGHAEVAEPGGVGAVVALYLFQRHPSVVVDAADGLAVVDAVLEPVMSCDPWVHHRQVFAFSSPAH